MELNLLKNAGKALKFVTKCTETPSLSSYLKKQSNPLLKATGKFLDFIGDDETPDYLKQSSNNYGKSGKVVDAGKTYQNGLDGAQRVSGKTFYR